MKHGTMRVFIYARVGAPKELPVEPLIDLTAPNSSEVFSVRNTSAPSKNSQVALIVLVDLNSIDVFALRKK